MTSPAMAKEVTYTIAIHLSIFFYTIPIFEVMKKNEFWVLFDMYTCILATKFG